MIIRPLLCVLLACVVIPVGEARAQTSADRLILEPQPGTIFTIEAHYPQRAGVCEFKQPKPLRAKYRGRLDVVRGSDGRLRLINSLPFETYLYGLAEVPPSWPAAALQAQAIAARSYALDAWRRGSESLKRKGADICSTDACQVYRGALVELGAFGERWVEAVDATRSEVLTYNGRVVQAFYFSTSDGRTRSSFPGGTPQPVYPSVDGEDDDAPLAQWVARVRLADLTRVLRARGEWSGRTISSITQSGGSVRLSDGAASRTFEDSDLRRALNQEAPCLFPERYPPEDEGKKLPQTIPSSSYRVSRSGSLAVFRGRGWGHFVGMSQWGANSLAERGRSERQILSHFYGPAKVSRVEVPPRIRVLAAEGLQRVRIFADGGFRARTGTGSVLAPTERFEVRGGKTLRIARGIGPSLKPVLTVMPRTTSVRADPGADIVVRFTLQRSARVSATLSSGDDVVRRAVERSVTSGPQAVRFRASDRSGAPLAAGNYQAIIHAYDGLDRVRSLPIAVVVGAPQQPPPADTPSGDLGEGARSMWFLLAAGVLLLGTVFGLWLRLRRPKINV